MASQFQNIFRKNFVNFLEAHGAKSLVSVGQTFMRGDNVILSYKTLII